jgi:hypothetical protein
MIAVEDGMASLPEVAAEEVCDTGFSKHGD